MMRNEFEQLTGIYPSTELYRAIEREYIAQDVDKTVFCEKYKNNTDGLAVKIQQAACVDACEELERQTREHVEHEQKVAEFEKRIDELNRQIAKLGALKVDLMILANDADNILAHGVVEDCEDVVIRFLHLVECYCGVHFEGLPE